MCLTVILSTIHTIGDLIDLLTMTSSANEFHKQKQVMQKEIRYEVDITCMFNIYIDSQMSSLEFESGINFM